MNKSFKIFIFLAVAIFLPLSLQPVFAQERPTDNMADTPWPMYQHDPQHTGRSPFLGPLHKPQLLWTVQLPVSNTQAGNMSISRDGDLMIPAGPNLYKYDPIKRIIEWTDYASQSYTTPLVAADGNFYFGYMNYFTQISLDGKENWTALLDSVLGFRSGITFGPDGNLYFVKNGFWSFTQTGDYRWFYPYGRPFSYMSPAIGLNGDIYVGDYIYDLCAYSSNGSPNWCLEPQGDSKDQTPAVGSDGTIYLPSDYGRLLAINPSGSVKWVFDPEEPESFGVYDALAIAPDGAIIIGELIGSDPAHRKAYLYSINPNGKMKWKISFPGNPITGISPFFYKPITVDRSGNVFFCLANSRCYGIDSNGVILWDFEFPLIDSISIAASVQPLLAADGLMYLLDNHAMVYAFADTSFYPLLESTRKGISFQVDLGTPAFTTTIPISSVVSPITYTASMTPTAAWISISNPTDITPSQLTVNIHPDALSYGRNYTMIQIKPAVQSGTWLEIPVTLNAGIKPVFLPIVTSQYKKPYRILHKSQWFIEPQLASIDQTGRDRLVNIPQMVGQIYGMTYSPDGLKVALFQSINSQYVLRILNTLTGQKLLEISSLIWNELPSFSPDSNRLAYVSTMDGAYGGEVYILNLDGTGLTRLTRDNLEETGLYWSPKGDKIAVTVSLNRDLAYLINPDGTDFHQIITGNWSDAPLGWSPDGDKLLLRSQSNNSGSPIVLGIYYQKTNTYSLLTDRFLFPGSAIWSPDGSLIAFTGWRETTANDWDIYIIKPDGSGIKDLTAGLSQQDGLPQWSPDSQWLAFYSNGDIYVMRFDGSNMKKITSNMGDDSSPFWVPY
jgi:Tol biopolymer transport system component